jgi:hypothetical protein
MRVSWVSFTPSTASHLHTYAGIPSSSYVLSITLFLRRLRRSESKRARAPIHAVTAARYVSATLKPSWFAVESDRYEMVITAGTVEP